MHFARVLRTAGMPVGTDRIQLALGALQVGGLESRRDFHAALAATLVDRAEHRLLFDQAFHIFWKNPDLEGRMRALLLPKVDLSGSLPPPPEHKRLAAAFFPNQGQQPPPPKDEPKDELQLDATLTWNDQEVLRKTDFETMSADEWRQAKKLIAKLTLMFEPLATRRTQRANRAGSADWRGSLRAMARSGGDLPVMRWREPRTRPAPLVVLADISGSMSRYSRMLLHFTHAVGHADLRVSSFVFGTRLTNTSRLMHQRDPDQAVDQVTRAVQDWAGGTRISACLHEFNRRWARRVLSGSPTVLLITDGLERGDTGALAFEMERLAKSCRRIVWLNPLLRFDAFEPRAAGIRAMLPHVDQFLTAHNIDSLAELAQVLATPSDGRSAMRIHHEALAATSAVPADRDPHGPWR
ncbi:MAG: VWA domain-containing protein [Leptothrix sp. (in: b-proteobacteria)]